MAKKQSKNNKAKQPKFSFSVVLFLVLFFIIMIILFAYGEPAAHYFWSFKNSQDNHPQEEFLFESNPEPILEGNENETLVSKQVEVLTVLDQTEYDRRTNLLAGGSGETTTQKVLATSSLRVQFADGSEGVIMTPLYTNVAVESKTIKGWPVKNDVYPKVGALLPFNRIIAYYGHINALGMGALGELYNFGDSEEDLLKYLLAEKSRWEAADPNTPVIPALHEIVTSAQGSPQADGSYSAYISNDKIDKVMALAEKINGIVFLDFQVGHADLLTQLKHYQDYFTLPQVHLGIDPEFSMKDGSAPGKKVGTFDAADINIAIDFLCQIVQEHNLPPKILVVHRFQMGMVTNYQNIKLTPEVQIVIHADGHGLYADNHVRSSVDQKTGIYNSLMTEPVQFAGIKIFYKNDTNIAKSVSLKDIFEKGTIDLHTGKCLSAETITKSNPAKPCWDLMTPQDVLNLRPIPIYVQYQ